MRSIFFLAKVLKTHNADPIATIRSATKKNLNFVDTPRSTVGGRGLFARKGVLTGLGLSLMIVCRSVASPTSILQKCDDGFRFKFIGETYVHSVMNREAVDGGSKSIMLLLEICRLHHQVLYS